ncbi:MAG: MFS transporter [Sphingomonadales bacterium]
MAEIPAETSDKDWHEPRYAWYVVIILTLAYTLSFIDRQIISLLVGPIKEDLGLSDFEISLLQGLAFASFYTLLGLPIGRLVDSKSRRTIIAAGIFLWSLMTVACGLAKSYGQLFMARVGVGVGEATLSPSAYSMIADYFPKEKLSRALSFYFMGVYLGTGLAFILGGLVIQLVAEAGNVIIPMLGEIKAWQLTFIAVGLPGFLFVLVMFTVREPKRRGLIRMKGGAEPHKVSLGEALRFVGQRWKLYLPIGLGFAFHALVGYGSAAWTPEFFIRTFDMPRADVAYVFGILVLVFSTSGLLTGGWLADWLEARGQADAKIRIAIYGNLGMLIPAVLFPLMPTPTLAFSVLAFSFFFAGMPYGVGAASLQVVTPNQMRGLVSAIYLFLLNIIGLGMGPSTVAFFTDFVFMDEARLGWSISITAAISIPVATFLLWLARGPYLAARAQAAAWEDITHE